MRILKIKAKISLNVSTVIMVLAVFVFHSCGTSKKVHVSDYYEYDRSLPLQDSLKLVTDSANFSTSYVTYRSVNNKEVTGLLSIPKNINNPVPIIILLHGKGDRKTVDYIEYGNQMLIEKGYATLRIDFSEHGDRVETDYEFDLTGDTKFWTRSIVSQTVYDLRRAIDFIETQNDLDADKIGFYGISLGGITGTIFCGVDQRVKVPVLALAGGQLNMMFGKKALKAETKDFVSIIEPKNYVRKISPRPLLMLNAENDDIIPPVLTKLLYKKAKRPKELIWYPAKHHTIPIDEVYREGINWFDKYLK